MKSRIKKRNLFIDSRKAILILCGELFVVAAALILTVLALSLSRVEGQDMTVVLQSTEFERSEVFKNLVQERLDDIVKNSRLKSNFERNGKFYGRKIVDLAEYINEGKISGKQKNSVGYYLEDLIRWSRKGLVYKYLDDDVVSAESDMPKSYEKGNLVIDGDEIDLKEEYYPARGRALFDYVNSSYNRSDLLNLLEASLLKIGEDEQDYRELSTELKGSKTNVRFFIEDYADKNTYSNVDKEEFKENDTIRTYGRYLILDSRSLEYESNMRVTDAYLYNLITKFSEDFDGNYYIEFGIDTDYPVVDSFSAARDQYYEYRPRIQASVMAAGFLLLLTLGVLVLLTVTAGKETADPDEEIKLLGFDRIKTEIAGLFFGSVVLFGSKYLIQKVYEYRNIPELSVAVAGVGTALIMLVFIMGFLSLVRRVKAGTLYEDSFLNWFLLKCRYISETGTIMQNGTLILIEIFAVFTLFVGMNAALVYRAFETEELIWWIILFILDVIIVIYFMNHAMQRKRILHGVQEMSEGHLEDGIDDSWMTADNAQLARAINTMSVGLKKALKSSIKTEKLRADLITNVSHDIKTPLTSIINYVDLLKRLNLKEPEAQEYLRILEQKSSRLKTLTEDLVEASKIESGNISLEMTKLGFGMIVSQMEGEIYERFEASGLELVTTLPNKELYISADGRRLFRVLDNIYNNVAKYAMPDTRVYADLKEDDGKAVFSLKNISKQALNIDASELTERFIRGDVSRSTEGSGLGLSIAENLTKLQGGDFRIYLDGDLFKVTISFDLYREPETEGDTGNEKA
ncbi:Signal transduction histidine kinase [Lachnospiraceae bacterium]|nr:Signal transduction histidine kinase [Lachnospiraceae bacterium]